jgi:hypothetical protein
MPKLKKGDVITVPCLVKQGPFSQERLITFETMDGSVSGFVQTDLLKEVGGRWYVPAIVLEIKGDAVKVRVAGSFFNTNGLATIKREFALAA